MLDRAVARLQEIVDDSKFVYSLPTDSSDQVQNRESNILNLCGCRDRILEDLRQPIVQILEKKLGEDELAEIVDADQVLWAQELSADTRNVVGCEAGRVLETAILVLVSPKGDPFFSATGFSWSHDGLACAE